MAAVASRYARALVEVVLGDQLDPAMASGQLQAFVDAVRDNDQLRKVWESPSIPVEQKRALLDAIARQIGAAKPLRNFLAVLIDHRRIPMLPQIARQFQVELDAQLGFAEAEITSSRELSQDVKRGLESQIERLTNKRVRARYDSNPALLGGVMIRVGSTIYDGSVRGQLQKMKEQLSTV
jgi:F-type H+-transporting ATPase subunit delta